jgi:hypothetical protein
MVESIGARELRGVDRGETLPQKQVRVAPRRRRDVRKAAVEIPREPVLAVDADLQTEGRIGFEAVVDIEPGETVDILLGGDFRPPVFKRELADGGRMNHGHDGENGRKQNEPACVGHSALQR